VHIDLHTQISVQCIGRITPVFNELATNMYNMHLTHCRTPVRSDLHPNVAPSHSYIITRRNTVCSVG
jgi:hypothetical protein